MPKRACWLCTFGKDILQPLCIFITAEVYKGTYNYFQIVFAMYHMSWEECVESYFGNQANKSAVSTDAERGKNQFDLETTDAFPFSKNSDSAFKEGYLCAVGAISNLFCAHCGKKNEVILPEYTSKKAALEHAASHRSAHAVQTPIKPGGNYNGFDGHPTNRRTPRLIRSR